MEWYEKKYPFRRQVKSFAKPGFSTKKYTAFNFWVYRSGRRKCHRSFNPFYQSKSIYIRSKIISLSDLPNDSHCLLFSCLQQLHSISKLLHTNHFILMELKEKFLFSFSMNLRWDNSFRLDHLVGSNSVKAFN